MKAIPTFPDYSFEGAVQHEEPGFIESESHESLNFLVGLGNGVWMSLVLGTLACWLVQTFVQALR